jgi:hypothetical protein
MIPGEGGRGAGMMEWAASCPPARHCPREHLKQLAALIYSHLLPCNNISFKKAILEEVYSFVPNYLSVLIGTQILKNL